MQKKFIFYIIAIIIVLAIVFLSQHAYFGNAGQTIISGVASQAAAYIAKGSSWLGATIYPRLSGEVQKRGEAIQNEVNLETEKISENILEKTKNYFSGIADSILHPGENNNCPPTPTN